MTSDDMYPLECWLRDKALEAHKKAHDSPKVRVHFGGKEGAFNEVISYIQSRRVSQRPHIRITEEFDGSR